MMNSSEIMNKSVIHFLQGSVNDRCAIQPTNKNLVFALVLMTICVVTFLGNASVILTVVFHRNLHSVTYVLLVSLALADLFVSMFSMPLRIHQTLRNGEWCLNKSTCAFWIWTDSFACCASITNLAAVGIERFIAIKTPLRYNSLVDSKTGLKMVAFVWTYSLIWASLGNLNWSHPGSDVFNTNYGCYKKDRIYYTVVAVFAFYLPLAVIVLCYSYLTKVAIVHATALHDLTLFEFHGTSRGCSFSYSDRTKRLIREVKATKMMAVVVGVFFICWFPFFVMVLKSLWSPSPIHPVVAEITRVLFVYILPNLNSALNPIIYMTFTRELRHAFMGFFKRFRQHPEDEV